MTDLSSKSILISDHGLFLSFGVRMAREGGFGKVRYYNGSRSQRPSFNERSVGLGYDGIEVVTDFWKAAEASDVIAFPDVMEGSLQTHLRQSGYKVWGSGMAEELEIYRYYSKKILEAVGLPVNPYKLITGIPALREYLQEHDDKFIKVSFLRGLFESRKHEKYWISKVHLDRLEYQLGPLADTIEFIVEDPIKTKLEVAADQMFCAGDFLSKSINGVEVKDHCYLGVVQETAEMADEFQRVNKALRPVLTKYDYCNFFSAEMRVKREPYVIDPCTRQGSPSGEAQLATWSNMPQIVWHGAHGEAIEPEHEAPYVAQAMIFNKGDEAEWCAIGIPEKIRDSVHLYFGFRRGKEDWVVPQVNGFDEAGSVTATGETPEEAIAGCEAITEQLEGDVSVRVDVFPEALKQFEIMHKQGISVEPIAVDA